jgi:cytochrome P450
VHPVFSAYLDGLIEERRAAAHPPDDVITRMLFTEVDGERLSPRMVRTQTMFLIIAGNETTRNLIGNCFHRLARDAELYARLRAEPALVGPLIEESLRLDAPVQLLARTCTRPIELDGVRIEAGERVLFSLAAANRDPLRWQAPVEFRLDRADPRDHLGFGAGPHICPGAYLARLETRVALETCLARVAQLELAPGYVWDPNPVFWAQGPRSLRVRLRAA